MRIPESLVPLFDYGIVTDVVRPLMSGKEAQIYVVVAGDKYCVAKVYKEAHNRSFKHRAEYTEGRKVRNSRDQRAMDKRSKHGRSQDEAAWRSTEVDMIHRLHAAGVRVPTPMHFIDGVLIMELIIDAEGQPAPRLADLPFTRESARAMYDRLLGEVQRMLAAGVVHGDLSDFNVLIGTDGPVIIDLPQAVDTAHNSNARKLLIRDVDNLHRFLLRYEPSARRLPYAEEMWDLFQSNLLTPDTKLTGRYRPAERRVDTKLVLDLISDANYDERKRRESLGLRGGPPPVGGSPGNSARNGGGGPGNTRPRPPGPPGPPTQGRSPRLPAQATSQWRPPGPRDPPSPRDSRSREAPRQQGRDAPPPRGGHPNQEQRSQRAESGGGRSERDPPGPPAPHGNRPPPQSSSHRRRAPAGRTGGGAQEARPVEVIVVRRPPPRQD